MILIPGDPRTTQYIPTLRTISGLIEHSSKMYLTAGDWRLLVAELDAQYKDALMDPTRPAPWHNGNAFQIGVPPNPVLTVINSGTDDDALVNRMNHETPGAIHFQARVQKLRVG